MSKIQKYNELILNKVKISYDILTNDEKIELDKEKCAASSYSRKEINNTVKFCKKCGNSVNSDVTVTLFTNENKANNEVLITNRSNSNITKKKSKLMVVIILIATILLTLITALTILLILYSDKKSKL